MNIGAIVQFALTSGYDSVRFVTKLTADGPSFVNTVYYREFDSPDVEFRPIRVMYGSQHADPIEDFHEFAVEEFQRKNGKFMEISEPSLYHEWELPNFPSLK